MEQVAGTHIFFQDGKKTFITTLNRFLAGINILTRATDSLTAKLYYIFSLMNRMSEENLNYEGGYLEMCLVTQQH